MGYHYTDDNGELGQDTLARRGCKERESLQSWNRDSPTLPLILVGAISERKIGPTQSPMPAPAPANILFMRRLVTVAHSTSLSEGTDLPKHRTGTFEAAVINAAPAATNIELAWTAPFLPYRSITELALRDPSNPPMVNTEVRRENVASDMRMHVGRL